MAEAIDYRMLCQLGSAENILDIGCGDGRLTTFLAYHTRKRVVGLDISGQGFTEAYGRAARSRITELVA